MIRNYVADLATPAWSPDKRQVAYSVCLGPNDPIAMWREIHMLNLSTGEDRLVFTGEHGCGARPVCS